MLDPAVIIKELGADRTDFRPHGMRHHLVQPTGMNDVGIVVEEKENLTARMLRGGVVERREVERAGLCQDPNSGIRCESLEQIERGRFLAAIVDDYDLERH